MANRWHDGLGRYGGDVSKMLNGSSEQAWAQVDPAFSLSTANPRTGTHALRLASGLAGANQARRVFGAALTEVYIGFAIYCAALPSTEVSPGGGTPGGVYVAALRDAANNPQLNIYLGTDGGLVVYRGGVLTGGDVWTGTLLDRTVPCIGAGSYHHVEIYAKIDGAAGAVEIRVDEVTRLNLTGQNTQATGLAETSQWALGRIELAGVPGAIDFADFYCNDTTDDGGPCNTFIGDCKSGDFAPNADTAQADFALSAGTTGYTLIDERPPNNADYLSLTGSAGESDFGLTNMPANATEILSVRPWILAWKDDAGTCTVAPNMKSSGTKGTVTGQPIATAPSYCDSSVPLDPDTGLPWTPTGFNGADLVVERTA